MSRPCMCILQAVTKGLLSILLPIALLASASPALAGDQSTAGRPSVMEFGAVWCAPCKKFAPIFDKVKSSHASKANFESYDIEKGQGPAFRNKYDIRAVPTVIILNGAGKPVFQHSGLMSEAELTAAVDQALK